MSDLVDRIRLRMEAKGITTIRALAEAAGQDESKVGAWLRRAYKPGGMGLDALAIALDTTTDWLLTGEEREASRPAPSPPSEAEKLLRQAENTRSIAKKRKLITRAMAILAARLEELD